MYFIMQNSRSLKEAFDFFIISDQNLVECMTSSIGSFAYFKDFLWNEKKYLK